MTSLIAGNRLSTAARRAVSIILCAVLVAAGLLDVQGHAMHAGHQHTVQALADTAPSIEYVAIPSDIKYHAHIEYARDGDIGSAADHHDGTVPEGDDGASGCGAHHCLTAIELAASKLATCPRYAATEPEHDALQASFDASGLYRPPILFL